MDAGAHPMTQLDNYLGGTEITARVAKPPPPCAARQFPYVMFPYFIDCGTTPGVEPLEYTHSFNLMQTPDTAQARVPCSAFRAIREPKRG